MANEAEVAAAEAIVAIEKMQTIVSAVLPVHTVLIDEVHRLRTNGYSEGTIDLLRRLQDFPFADGMNPSRNLNIKLTRDPALWMHRLEALKAGKEH